MTNGKLRVKSEKLKYIEFSKVEENLPIFFQPWWLDATAGEDNWDVVIFENDNDIIAALPYYKKNKLGFTFLLNPMFTNRLGIYYKYYENLDITNNSKKLSFEKDIFTYLIEKLPKFSWFNIDFNYEFINHLPFYWKGYSQTTKYSYVIDDISDPEKCLKNFDRSKRNDIKKAQEKIDIKFDLPAEDFYNHHKNSLENNGSNILYSFDQFKKIYNTCYKNKTGKVIYSIDKNKPLSIHSANFIIWDRNFAYNLLSTIDEKNRNSGSTSLLIYEIIKFLSNKTKKFDFEGSMIEKVEQSFRKFGTKQVTYFNINKSNSKIIDLYLMLNKQKRGNRK